MSRKGFVMTRTGNADDRIIVRNLRQAQTSSAVITCVRRTGALFFNANGSRNGFGAGEQFADLTNGLNLTAGDLVRGNS